MGQGQTSSYSAAGLCDPGHTIQLWARLLFCPMWLPVYGLLGSR